LTASEVFNREGVDTNNNNGTTAKMLR